MQVMTGVVQLLQDLLTLPAVPVAERQTVRAMMIQGQLLEPFQRMYIYILMFTKIVYLY